MNTPDANPVSGDEKDTLTPNTMNSRDRLRSAQVNRTLSHFKAMMDSHSAEPVEKLDSERAEESTGGAK